MTLDELNEHIKQNVSEYITLNEGEGFFYFIYYDGTDFEEIKVNNVTNLNHFTHEFWVDIAKTLSAAIYLKRNPI